MMKGSHPHRGAQRHQWRLSQTHETLSQLLQGCPRRASAPGARKDPAPWAHQGKSLGYCIGQDWEEGRIRSFVLCLCISVCFGVISRLCTQVCVCTHVLTAACAQCHCWLGLRLWSCRSFPSAGLLLLATCNTNLVGISRQSLKLNIHDS